VTGGWRKLHNEDLRNLYSPPIIIRMMKSRRSTIENELTFRRIYHFDLQGIRLA
jgi:hypothetical protein